MWYIYSFLDWLTDWLVINIYKKISSDTHRRFSDYLNFPFTFHLNTTCHPLPVLSTYSVLLFILAWKSTRYILQNQPNRKNFSAKSLKYKSPDIMAWRKRKIVKESSTGRFFKHSRRKRNYKCNILQFGEIRIILGKNIYHWKFLFEPKFSTFMSWSGWFIKQKKQSNKLTSSPKRASSSLALLTFVAM